MVVRVKNEFVHLFVCVRFVERHFLDLGVDAKFSVSGNLELLRLSRELDLDLEPFVMQNCETVHSL